MHKIVGLFLLIMISGCQDATSVASDETPIEDAPVQEARALPPGFLDEAPALPQSNTVVLAGSVFIGSEPIPDSIVVITDGKLMSWGARGRVDVPNDSVGKDLRGKWIAPGLRHVESDSIELNPALLMPGAPANLLILDQDPMLVAPGHAHVSGWVEAGEMHLPEAGT